MIKINFLRFREFHHLIKFHNLDLLKHFIRYRDGGHHRTRLQYHPNHQNSTENNKNEKKKIIRNLAHTHQNT